MNEKVERFLVTPESTTLETLTASEIRGLLAESREEENLFVERCVLAVTYSGQETDDTKAMLEQYSDFAMDVIRTPGGIELELRNVPSSAFVTYESFDDGQLVTRREMIEGVRQNIFAVLRDLIYIKSEMEHSGKFDLGTSSGITDAVFLILRNARIFSKSGKHKRIVCWGGHAIGESEYTYTKEVGYQLGLRGIDIITGCGAGAMKGPMKGATIAHSKQRVKDACYIGITEPGIIVSEAPNPIVDPLVIMPDIEKRLEAFVRLGHGIIIFPGGVGTAEEIMYILGILSHPKNNGMPFPLILSGPDDSREYLETIKGFLEATLGVKACKMFQVIVGDPERVAIEVEKSLHDVRIYRTSHNDAYFFNRRLHIPPIYQAPFTPNHETVEALNIHKGMDTYMFAQALRQVFSAVVWGNIKPDGVRAVEKLGPLKIRGERSVMDRVDELLTTFADQKRMLLSGEYKPCYRIIK